MRNVKSPSGRAGNTSMLLLIHSCDVCKMIRGESRFSRIPKEGSKPGMSYEWTTAVDGNNVNAGFLG